MIQRIGTLTVYLLNRLFFSWIGVWLIAATGIYYYLAFRTRTPEQSYFILVIGLFGVMLTFLGVMAVASRANEAASYPFLVRLESRIEYLLAVLLAGILYAFILQALMTIFVLLRNNPQLTPGQISEAPPVWLAVNLLIGVLALHASDFVSSNWSRVWVFGILAILILLGESYSSFTSWLSELLYDWSFGPTTTEAEQQVANTLRSIADGLVSSQGSWIEQTTSLLFWPFESVIDAAVSGFFTRGQALAPAVMVLMATVLFLIAADIFANKDMVLSGD